MPATHMRQHQPSIAAHWPAGWGRKFLICCGSPNISVPNTPAAPAPAHGCCDPGEPMGAWSTFLWTVSLTRPAQHGQQQRPPGSTLTTFPAPRLQTPPQRTPGHHIRLARPTQAQNLPGHPGVLPASSTPAPTCAVLDVGVGAVGTVGDALRGPVDLVLGPATAAHAETAALSVSMEDCWITSHLYCCLPGARAGPGAAAAAV